MKKFSKLFAQLRFLPIVLLLMLSTQSCTEDEDEEVVQVEARQETSIIPTSYSGRPVTADGTITVESKSVTFNVWDSGIIDGDIITLVVNGRIVLSEYSLLGTKKSIAVTLDNLGYNYVLLYAHNEGTSPPNTAALSVTDSSGNVKNLVLSANLTSNSAYNIVVQ